MAFNNKLKTLNFKLVDFDEITMFLYQNYNHQSIFEPLQQPIEAHHYIELVKYFPDYDEIINLINFEFCEYYRIQILHENGYTTKDGYCYSPDNIQNIYKYWNH